MGRAKYTDSERQKKFWERVDQSAGLLSCWEWKGCLDSSGYGSFRFDGKTGLAHRYSWMLCNGNIPKGKHVLHKCDNRKCINPAHFFLGTNADNMRDRNLKGRQASKLTAANVLEIKELLSRGLIQQAIANRFGVARRTIGDIKSGATWGSIG